MKPKLGGGGGGGGGGVSAVTAPCLPNVNLDSEDGLRALAGILEGKIFVSGGTPTSADAELATALSKIPNEARSMFPQVRVACLWSAFEGH